MRVLLDLTDLVEFRREERPVSGVQRVVMRTAPLLLEQHSEAVAVVLDRGRGRFVPLTAEETAAVLGDGESGAEAILDRARTAAPVGIDQRDVLLFLGAVWINDALMLAARNAQAAGARCVYLLYDLTPVLAAGHVTGVDRLFDRYLHLLADTASEVPAISASSRRDLERWCAEHDLVSPPGQATGLPCGITPDVIRAGSATDDRSPWPRAYVLMVGTIEARKNHLHAFRAWEELIRRHGPDTVPDLLIVGRIGWNAEGFLEAVASTGGLDGRVHVLSDGVDDATLGRYYRHAEFTMYPSTYEGWGLPVSESLAFGTPVITTDASSLPEAGRDLAVYVPVDDVPALVAAAEPLILDPEERDRLRARIAAGGADPHSWQQVAHEIWDAVESAAASSTRPRVAPQPGVGHEYSLAGWEDGGRTPLLDLPRADGDAALADGVVTGVHASPQGWGYPLAVGDTALLRFSRPSRDPLVLLVATLSRPGWVEVAVQGGVESATSPTSAELLLGAAIVVDIGTGAVGEPVEVRITLRDATTGADAFLGLTSFAVVADGDLRARAAVDRAEAMALRAEVAALRTQIAAMEQSRSWRLTAPLRRGKGGSA